MYPLHLLYTFTWVTFVITGILKSLYGEFQSNFYQHTPQLPVLIEYFLVFDYIYT